MHCHEVKQAIDNGLSGPMAAEELSIHLRRCEQCMEYAEDVRLQRLLRSLSVPEPAPQFSRRVMAPALARLESGRASARTAKWTPMAAAAVVVLAVALLWGGQLQMPTGPRQHADTVAVYVEPNRSRVVDVVLNSEQFVEGALLTVQLDDNVVLDRANRTRTLQWRSDLKAGGNRLSLPVRLLGAGSGEVQITIEHAGKKRQLKVLVKEGSAKEPNKTVI